MSLSPADSHRAEAHQDVRSDRHLTVCHRLRERRLELGLTQKQVVRRLGGLGVAGTNKTLSSLEHGAGLDVGRLPELAAALDCSVTWLLGLTDDPHQWEPDPLGRRAPTSDGAPEPVPRSTPGGAPEPGSWILAPLPGR